MKRKTRQQPDDKKLRELVLYICERSEGDEAFGSAKLNKLLYLADFESYAATWRSITGHAYTALPQGPSPVKLKSITEKMKLRGDLAFQKRDYRGVMQLKPVALRQADIDAFTPGEISRIDNLIHKFWGRHASQMIEEEEPLGAWKIARKGETIPYGISFISNRELTPDEIRRGLKLSPTAKGH